MAENKKKIVLIGTGMVGMSFAYAALNQSLCDELVLIDLNEQRAHGEAMDLNHGLAFSNSSMKISCGTYQDCGDADIVVICAGVNQKPAKADLSFCRETKRCLPPLCLMWYRTALTEFSLLPQTLLTL